ncbi:carboxypeptidase-like regulatory domain-containing protein [Persicitalea sp.]|uniref:TonB-dependent receptor n=1 Tax=Persicitalea sp. TaxID=3100273 RepID=UPI00359465C9
MLFVTWLLSPELLLAQRVTISGTVHDRATGELLIGATVSDPTDRYGAITNQYGFFSVTVPSQIDTLEFSYVGYATFQLAALNAQPSPIDIRLSPQRGLDEVVIKGKRETAGQFILPVSRIKSIPALLGEVDVLKALSLTPGVMTGGEGTAGLYVRGGTPDQNLILLDEAPVYNVMHLGGFFSVFNPNTLKSVSLYKGPFPARYGGRLSSVIDLTMKDGNKKKMAGQVGIGLLSQNLTIEGPIIKDKASFIVSGRISTLGVTRLIRPRKSKTGFGDFPSYGFYDLNAKFNYQLSATDQFYVSLYQGDDDFRVNEWSNNDGQRDETSVGIRWGNTTATARYSKILSDKLFARAVLIYSRYNSGFNTDYSQYDSDEDRTDEYYSHTDSRVRDYGFKLQFDHFPKSFLSLKYGADVTVHTFSPFRLQTNYELAGGVPPVANIVGTQVDGFVESSTTFKRFRADVGLRGSLYRVQNSTFVYPEPRLGLNWNGPRNWSVKAGYSVMNQYVLLLTNNGLGLSFDAWVPSTSKVPPANAQQWSLGLYKEFPKPASTSP